MSEHEHRTLAELLPADAINDILDLASSGRYRKADLMPVLERHRADLLAKGVDADYLGYMLEFQLARMIEGRTATPPFANVSFPDSDFPITIRIFDRNGAEIWNRVVPRPDGVAAVAIPGFADRGPVRVTIERRDGTIIAHDGDEPSAN